jgi:hypothetical protein
VNAQLDDAAPNWFAVAKIAGLHLPQANSDASLGCFVAQGVQPFRKRFAAIVPLVTKDFDHRPNVAFKLLRRH